MSDMNREDAERLVRLEEGVKRLEHSLENGVSRLEKAMMETHTDHRTRLRALEAWRYGTGAAVVAGAAYWLQPIMGALP